MSHTKETNRSRQTRPKSARVFAAAAAVTLVLPVIAIAETPWVAPADAASKKNPFAGKADAAAAGKQIFTTTCVPCHGAGGKGDGAAAAALNPKPANYTTAAITAESDGSLYWKLSEGRGAMVGMKSTLSDRQRWELITYIRTLQKRRFRGIDW